jgi:hypothetical protein
VQVGRDALDGVGERAGMGFGFQHARAGDEEEFTGADLEVAEREGVRVHKGGL